MKTIEFWVSLDLAGCRVEEEMDIEEDMTEEEIEKLVHEEVIGHVDWGWRDKK